MTSSDPINRAIDSIIASVRSLLRLVVLKILSPIGYQIWSLFTKTRQKKPTHPEPFQGIRERLLERKRRRQNRRKKDR